MEHNKSREKLFHDERKFTEKQMDILAAATELFAEKGFAATSTSEIARKAGVAEGTIFRHYKTKKELLLSIVNPLMVNLIGPIVKEDINKVLDTNFNHFEEFILAMIDNRRVFIEKNLSLLQILIQEISFHPELKEQFIEHIGKEIFGRLQQVIRHFQAKREIILIPASSVIRMAGSTVLGYIMTRNIIASADNWDDEAEVERTVQFLMKGLSP